MFLLCLFWLQVVLLLRHLPFPSSFSVVPGKQMFKITKSRSFRTSGPFLCRKLHHRDKYNLDFYILPQHMLSIFLFHEVNRSPIYRNLDEAFLFIGSRISVFSLYTICLFLHVQLSLEFGCFGICNACWLWALQNMLDFIQLCNNLLFISCQLSAQTSLFSHVQPGWNQNWQNQYLQENQIS